MNLSIGKKMGLNTFLFSIVALIPLIILGVMAVRTAHESFIQNKFDQLVSIREIKKTQIEDFFKEREGDMGVLVEMVNTLRREAFAKLEAVQMIKKNQIEGYFEDRLEDISALSKNRDILNMYDTLVQYHIDTHVSESGPYDVTTSKYKELYDNNCTFLKNHTRTNGYSQMFIICAAHGHVMFTTSKGKDLGTNLSHGPYKDSPLAKLWHKVLETDAVAIQDFEPYAPSDNEPACFVGAPLKKDGKRVGVLVFQLSTDAVNAIMAERTGMGKTGEVYLVGPDKRMRSDSFLDPQGHSVNASFAGTLENNGVDTQSSCEALSGKAGAEVILDYNGNPVLSAYDPVSLQGLNWAIIAEMDVAEAFNPKDEAGKEFYAKYVELYGYYDLFLMNPDGYAFYTVAKEADYQTNLLTGKYSGSNLGKLIRQVVDGKQFGMADFAPYAPSNDDPAAFIARPVINNGKTEIVIALQLSLEAINNIMQKREGLGKTGETYLVGPDHLMRSDSFLDSTNHSVKASFANPSTGSVKTLAAQEALAGKPGQEIIMDYNGHPVLSAYSPVKIGDTAWAIIAEIDEAEVVQDSVAAKILAGRVWSIGIVSMLIVVCVILMSIFIVRNLSKTLLRVIEGLSSSTEQVASAAGQVSTSSQSLAEGASEQAASIEETSSSMEEMSSMTRKNAENAAQADGLMKEANQVVTTANTSMGQLTQSMEDISKAGEETSKIIKAIDEISFQTNLLALNAAVEAARAGEAGAGFAIVADEVRNLAIRAADAAKDTAGLIEGTVKKVNDGSKLVATTNDAFSHLAESTAKVGDIVSKIAEASKGQSNGIEQVNLAITEMDKVIQQNAANAEESASASEEMNAQAEQLKEYVGDLVMLVTGKKT